MVTIGQQIKQVRLDHGLTQKEFGERVGVANTHLSDIESGKVIPNGRLIESIAAAFGLEFAFIDRVAGMVTEISPALQEFAHEAGLTKAEVRMLAAQRYRGKAPRTKEGYRFLWDAIRLVCDRPGPRE